MRKTLSTFPSQTPVIGRAISATFSTSSGRGRSTPFQFTPDSNPQYDDVSQPQSQPQSHGRGRGQPIQPSPTFPSFSNTPPRSFSNPIKDENPKQQLPAPTDILDILSGAGRGKITQNAPVGNEQVENRHIRPRPPLPQANTNGRPNNSFSPASSANANMKVENVENRHIRPRPPPPIADTNARTINPFSPASNANANANANVSANVNANASVNGNDSVKNSSNEKQLTREEKVKKATDILSKCGDGGVGNVGENYNYNNHNNNNNSSMRESSNYTRGGNGERGREPEREQGGRGERGGRGGRGRGRGRGRERHVARGDRDTDDEDDVNTGDDEIDTEDDEGDFNIGDDAEGEKMAKKVGPEVMDMLVEGFDEAFDRVLPDPEVEDYKDALEINFKLECEPEYFMGEFTANPDIDDKPIMPLRDALEKMKPFLMSYEGIQSHEEWEAVVEETMKDVPLMKKIVDDYGGPDRATAKQQQAELERVAKTLPTSAPDSVRRFTERAVLSLQSNPGWGFDKKCQYMDKLVMESSQQYK